ncbi:hypothetical protein ACFQY7_22785 [Actinomadura luteofluorescens]|uniref:hypothetical protein n=1 Tax=Actinomadura luteofluorescens TaxID=46163 RepID=UPI00363BB72D
MVTTAAGASAASRGLARRVAGSPWTGYLARRLGGVAAVLAFLVVVTFMIVRWVPGDPARQIVGLTAARRRCGRSASGSG